MAGPYHIAWYLREIRDHLRLKLEGLDELQEFASKYLSYPEKFDLRRKVGLNRGFTMMPGSVKSDSEALQLCQDIFNSESKFQDRFEEDSRLPSIGELVEYKLEWKHFLNQVEYLLRTRD